MDLGQVGQVFAKSQVLPGRFSRAQSPAEDWDSSELPGAWRQRWTGIETYWNHFKPENLKIRNNKDKIWQVNFNVLLVQASRICRADGFPKRRICQEYGVHGAVSMNTRRKGKGKGRGPDKAGLLRLSQIASHRVAQSPMSWN